MSRALAPCRRRRLTNYFAGASLARACASRILISLFRDV